MTSTLSQLGAAGVLRGGRTLRVDRRFLSYAERLAAERGLSPERSLEAALATWDDYRGDPYTGARLLYENLADRHQLGLLRPVFPTLDAFAVAA